MCPRRGETFVTDVHISRSKPHTHSCAPAPAHARLALHLPSLSRRAPPRLCDPPPPPHCCPSRLSYCSSTIAPLRAARSAQPVRLLAGSRVRPSPPARQSAARPSAGGPYLTHAGPPEAHLSFHSSSKSFHTTEKSMPCAPRAPPAQTVSGPPREKPERGGEERERGGWGGGEKMLQCSFRTPRYRVYWGAWMWSEMRL